MDTVIAFLSLALFIAFVVGLIKPSLVRMPNRKRSSAIYLGGCLVMGVVSSTLYPSETASSAKDTQQATITPPPPKTFEYSDKTLKEYRNESKETRHDIINEYVSFKNIPASADDDFYACMSEYTFSKDGELKLGDVLEWCNGDFEKDPNSLKSKISLDNFQGKFSGWDGSYRPLEKLIKSNMNDDSSYKHVSTVYHLILNKDPHAIVKTTFLGTNSYGAVVKETIAARVDVRTGEIESIIEN